MVSATAVRDGASGDDTAGGPPPVALAARDVGKTYGAGTATPRTALRDVTLDVPAGRFLAVMGPSGSGKSTLLHLFGGLDTPTTGEVRIEGRSLVALDDAARADVRRHKVGFVFQAFNLVPVLTVAENVALPGVIAGEPHRDCARRAAELLELVGVPADPDRLPAELSGGEQQRVAIARALFMRPAVLLADEPTGNLDSATGHQVLELLLETHGELGQTIVVVTHDVRVAAVADEVVLLGDGTVAGRVDVGEVVDGGRRARGAREAAVQRLLRGPPRTSAGRR